MTTNTKTKKKTSTARRSVQRMVGRYIDGRYWTHEQLLESLLGYMSTTLDGIADMHAKGYAHEQPTDEQLRLWARNCAEAIGLPPND